MLITIAKKQGNKRVNFQVQDPGSMTCLHFAYLVSTQLGSTYWKGTFAISLYESHFLLLTFGYKSAYLVSQKAILCKTTLLHATEANI